MTAVDPDADEREQLEAEADATRARLLDTLDRLDGRPDNVFRPATMVRSIATRAAIATGASVAAGVVAYVAIRALTRPRHLAPPPPALLERMLSPVALARLARPPRRSLPKRALDIGFDMAAQAVVQATLQWLATKADSVPSETQAASAASEALRSRTSR